MNIESPLDLSTNALAEVLTHCFEGYIMPAHFQPAQLAGMIKAEAVDLSASLTARNDNEVTGIALIARRGKLSRVAAMAVAKSARRQGVGRSILEKAIQDAKERGDQQMILEVIEQNPPAIALYEKSGFYIQHRLVGFEAKLPKGVKKAPPIEDATFSEVAAALRSRGPHAYSWSMAPATVEQLATPSKAVRVGDVLAIFWVAGEETVACRNVVFTGTPTVQAARKFIDALAVAYPGRKLFIPAFFPEGEYSPALTGAGLKIAEISLFQMANDLGNPHPQEPPDQASYKAGPAQPVLLQ